MERIGIGKRAQSAWPLPKSPELPKLEIENQKLIAMAIQDLRVLEAGLRGLDAGLLGAELLNVGLLDGEP